ncbi:hypothetical protein [Synechococcus phage S-B68]|nr:hypothetical protein [Synechococcus phage S-B68]
MSTLNNTDVFLVSRSGTSYQVSYQDVNGDASTALTNAASAQSDATQAISDAATAQSTADAAVPAAGGNMTGALTGTERTITAGAFDLTTGNYWTCGAITVPNPSGGVAGQSGLIRITAGPVVWSANFKFPAATAPTLTSYPAIIPFYVQDSTTILMGTAVEGIA